MSRAKKAIPDDPMQWVPLRPLPTRKPVTITDPIVEPLWSGTRVLVHFAAGKVAAGTGIGAGAGARAGGAAGAGASRASGGTPRPPTAPRLVLTDEDGDEIALDEPVVLRELGRAITADDAVIDGVLTVEVTRTGEGTALIAEPRTSIMGMMLSREPGIDVERKDSYDDPVLGFVAVDLLRVDGQSLLDVPLLERKRHLESVIVPSQRIRLSIYTRPPIDAWVASWKAAGLRGAMLKAANSHYVPGGYSPEWRAVTRIAGRQ